MHAAAGTDHDRIVGREPVPARTALPDTDALLSELGALSPLTPFWGNVGDQPPAGAWEAPSGTSTAETVEGRRSEMDDRILAGLLWQ